MWQMFTIVSHIMDFLAIKLKERFFQKLQYSIFIFSEFNTDAVSKHRN
jgi:hypothetical protein